MEACRRPRTRFPPCLLQFLPVRWLAAPVARRLSSVHVLRFRPSVWHASVNLTALHPWIQICYVYPFWCMSCFQWIRCDPGVLDRMLRGRIDLRGRILELAVPGIHDPAWVDRALSGQPRPRTVQETVLHDLYATCCLKIRVILVGELCVGRERRIYPRYSVPTNVVRELLSRVSFASSFDSSLGWQVDRIYLAGLRTGIWRGWSSSCF